MKRKNMAKVAEDENLKKEGLPWWTWQLVLFGLLAYKGIEHVIG